MLVTALLPLLLSACIKDDPGNNLTQEQRERKAINYFLKESFGSYYYWIDSMRPNLDRWGDTDEPVEAYEKFKHSDDRWGFVSDRGKEISAGFDGVTTSYGYNGVYMVYKDTVVLVVEYTSADTPASKAGIKRGDVISKFNGKYLLYREGDDIDEINKKLNELIQEVNSKTTTFTYAFTGKTVTMTPETVYENPINVSKVFDFGGKKVAYLHYTHFDTKSLRQLVDVFAGYKSEGVSELVLDLRYNGGGYLAAEGVLASLTAPLKNVNNRDLYNRTEYNEFVASVLSDNETCLSPQQIIDGETVNIAAANPDLKKIYVLMTGNTASASELLVNGLLPYSDIELYGERSYGKTASCLLILGKDWYDNYKEYITQEKYSDGIAYASDWCGYVTLGYNVNALGEAKCCPYGYAIDDDKAVEDNPSDGFQLGDPRETMLAKVLASAGYSKGTKAVVPSQSDDIGLCRPIVSHKELMLHTWGIAIENHR